MVSRALKTISSPVLITSSPGTTERSPLSIKQHHYLAEVETGTASNIHSGKEFTIKSKHRINLTSFWIKREGERNFNRKN
jgi:hypothetical protein